jgi:hypothetical protein
MRERLRARGSVKNAGPEDLSAPIGGFRGLSPLHESDGAITFRIGINKSQIEELFRIPQSAFPNPQWDCSSTPTLLYMFTCKAIELGPGPQDQVFDAIIK